jgi:hypothetical protein
VRCRSTPAGKAASISILHAHRWVGGARWAARLAHLVTAHGSRVIVEVSRTSRIVAPGAVPSHRNALNHRINSLRSNYQQATTQ